LRNPAVQRLRRLARQREARQDEGTFVVEGAKVLGEARSGGASIDAVFIDLGSARESDRELADTVSPQPIAATVKRVDEPLGNSGSPTLAIVLAGVSDPGNAGTLIRSAAAAGADLVVLCKPSVDLYNPKTVRASAGAMFHIRVTIDVSLDETLQHLGMIGVTRWATAARGGIDYASADLSLPCAIVVGNEAHGVPVDAAAGLDGVLTIPVVDATESLNVAVAGSLVCFEAARQRRSTPGEGSAGQRPGGVEGAA
jgi:TrmH family RNA methyltransferase